MSKKKDFLYQFIIAILLVAVAFAFYKLYKEKEDFKESKIIVNVDKSVDIKLRKPEYEPIELKYLSKINNMPKLNNKLAKLDASFQKSMQMVEEYNLEHPDNQIEVDIDVNLDIPYLPKSDPYASLDIESRYEQQSQRVESFINENSSTETTSDTKESSSSDKPTDRTTGSSSASLASSGGSSSGSSTSGGSFVNSSNTNEVTITEVDTSTTYASVDGDIKKYTSSISEIQTVMSQITANLE